MRVVRSGIFQGSVLALLLATFLPHCAAAAEAASREDALQAIVVSATRVSALPEDLPLSQSRLDERTLTQGELEVNLSETLDQVPGVVAQNRQNYAQDLQMSVRGFGARSSFGVRGVRLYADGIPATMPDGQGQFSHFDLGSAAYIDVLRGPFSALYGNSSGGVISIFTRDGRPGLQIEGTAEAGSFGTERYALEGSGATGPLNYLLDASHFHTDGYREHSEAERNLLNGKLSFDLADGSTMKLVVNAIETPFVEDPLGLTRAEWNADPSQAGIGALQYDTRKSLAQEQAGLAYSRRLGDDGELAATAYDGHRHTTQFQAIPESSQLIATAPGGVIDLERSYWGIDWHAIERFAPAGQPLQATVGMSYDRLNEDHRGYLNFIGSQFGVEGALRRDDANRVFDFDQYLELEWDPTSRLRVVAGVRNSTVDVASTNLLVLPAPVTGVHYSATNPVAGVTFRAAPGVDLYASYGKGFETPTLNDLAYRSTNGTLPGLNLGLKPARSENYEIGIKGGVDALKGSLAAFDIRTRDELAVAANAGGRSVYENIGSTERRGAEAALDARWSAGLSARLAYTYIRAVVTQPYQSCPGVPCQLVTIAAGSHLPAVPASSLYAGLTWHPRALGPTVTLEAINRSAIFVDDRNSDAAPAYWIANLAATLEQQVGPWSFRESLRVENLTDRRYVGSVIVNESNSRFFEPEPGRTAYLLLHLAR